MSYIQITRESGFATSKYHMPSDQILADRWFTLEDDFFNWDSSHAGLNSHYEAWSYKEKKHRQFTAYRTGFDLAGRDT